jgi:hypothetical protein
MVMWCPLGLFPDDSREVAYKPGLAQAGSCHVAVVITG